MRHATESVCTLALVIKKMIAVHGFYSLSHLGLACAKPVITATIHTSFFTVGELVCSRAQTKWSRVTRCSHPTVCQLEPIAVLSHSLPRDSPVMWRSYHTSIGAEQRLPGSGTEIIVISDPDPRPEQCPRQRVTEMMMGLPLARLQSCTDKGMIALLHKSQATELYCGLS